MNVAYSSIRGWFSRLGGLACCLGLVVAQHAGAASIQMSHFPPNPGVMPGGGWKWAEGSTFADPTPARAWVNGVYGGVPGIQVTDSILLAGKGGPLALTAVTSATLKDAAIGIASCLIGGGPIGAVCAVASAAAVFAGAYRTYADSGGALKHDPGQPPASSETTEWRFGQDGSGQLGPWMSDKASACAAAAGGYPGWTPHLHENGTCYFFNASGSTLATNYGTRLATGTQCPGSIDPTDSAYNVLPGEPVGPDGLCKTARYNHVVVTPTQFGDAVSANPPGANNQPFVDGLKDALDHGVKVPGNLSVSGPSTQTGAPVVSTTTGPGGVTQTSQTPTYTYNYNNTNNTITNTTTTTTTTTNNGTVVSTTEDTADPEKNDPCKLNPDSLMCQKLGEAPTDEIPKGSKTIDFAPESVGLASGCPVGGTVAGHQLSYAQACESAEQLRPFLIAAAGISAALMVVFALRGQ